MATYDISNDEWDDDEPEYVPPSPVVSYASTVPTLPLDNELDELDELDDELDNGLLPPPDWQPVEVPVLPHYELCDIPGVDNEHGLFATEDIEPGTRIIAERPLFTLPHPGDQLPELMAAYSNLSPPDKHLVDSLRPAHPSTTEQLHNIDELTTKLFAELRPILTKPTSERTPSENSLFEYLMPKFANATRILRTAARWHANRCSMTNLPQDQRAHLPAGTPVSGLFPIRAQMRHSCVPNCFASYNPTTTHLTVHTTRAIAAGTELTVSAFADEMYYLDSSARYSRFAMWGLACSCEACDTTHPAYDGHEAVRQRTHARVVLTLAVLSHWDPPSNLPHHAPAPLSLADLDDAQTTILALCDDLRRTGCTSAEHVRWRIALVTHIVPARAALVGDDERVRVWRDALEQVGVGEAVGDMCFGVDREEVRLLGVLKGWIERELREAVARVVEVEMERRGMEMEMEMEDAEGGAGGGGGGRGRSRGKRKRFRRRKR